MMKLLSNLHFCSFSTVLSSTEPIFAALMTRAQHSPYLIYYLKIHSWTKLFRKSAVSFALFKSHSMQPFVGEKVWWKDFIV